MGKVDKVCNYTRCCSKNNCMMIVHIVMNDIRGVAKGVAEEISIISLMFFQLPSFFAGSICIRKQNSS